MTPLTPLPSVDAYTIRRKTWRILNSRNDQVRLINLRKPGVLTLD